MSPRTSQGTPSLLRCRRRGRIWWFVRFVHVYRKHGVLRFNGGLRGAWRDAQFSRRAMNPADQRKLRPIASRSGTRTSLRSPS